MNRRQQLQPLIGRVRSLSVRRPGFALALCGPPGMGKSHSALQLAAALPQAVIAVRAAATGPELARAWRAAALVPGWAVTLLTQLESGLAVTDTDLVRAFSAVLKAQAPALVLLEDLHECGPGRLELWIRLARAAQTGRGVALVWTSRGRAPEGFESLWLAPLDEAELGALLEAEGGVPLPAGVRRWLAQRSGGNPLFALEFLRDLRRRGDLWLDGQTWRWRGPDFMPAQTTWPGHLEALIERALDALSPAAGRLLEVRTLLADCAAEQASLWCPLSGLDPAAFQAARCELEEAGILREHTWSHTLFLEMVQARLPAATRRRDAAAAIRALGTAQPLRAAEWVERAELRGAAAARCYGQAADASLSPQAASGWRRLALPHLPRQERAGRALALLAELGGAPLGQQAEVLDLALDAEPQHLELVSRRARLWARQGQPERARPMLEALERRDLAWQLEWLKLLFALGENAAAFALWDGTPALHSAVPVNWTATMVAMLAYQERFAEGLALAERWLSQPNLSALETARLHNARGVLYQTWGQPQRALEDYMQALAHGEGAGPSDTARLAQGNAAMIHHTLENFAQAEVLFACAAQAMLEAGDVVGYASTQTTRAANRSDQGHFGDAETLLLEAHAILGPAGASHEALECEIFLSRVYALWGQPLHAALALRHAQRALEGARKLGGRHMLRWALESAASCEARLGDPARALALLEAGGQEFGPGEPSAETQLSRALALERLGQGAEALALLETVCAAHPDDEVLALDLDRLRGDRAAAQARSGRFAARGHGLGVHLARQFFPPGPLQNSLPSVWRLEVLGPFRLGRHGQARPLRGEKRRLLLSLLLEARLAGSPELSGEALTGALYPGAGVREARTALRQLVYQVRAALGPELVLTAAQGYRLGAVGSDAEQFLESGQTGLWRGPYLDSGSLDGGSLNSGSLNSGSLDSGSLDSGSLDSGHGLGLGLQDGGTVGEGLAEGLRRAGFAALAQAGPGPSREAAQEGVRVARLLLTMDPYDAAALELGLRACRHLGHYSAVHRLYAQARRDWHEIGEALPAHWGDFLTFRTTHQQLAPAQNAADAS